MSTHIKGFRVGNEVKKVDYGAVANPPEELQLDATLKVSGMAADARAVGDSIAKLTNALHNVAIGQTVKVADVSPIQHTPKVVVTGKNMLNCAKLNTTNRIVDNGDGSITVTPGTGNAVVPSKTLGECIPGLFPGVEYVLSGESTSDTKAIYLTSSGRLWQFGTSCILTEAEIGGKIYIYGKSGTSTVVSKLQVEVGSTATEYEPYVNASGATLTYNNNTYYPNLDGEVDGIMSNAPTMQMSVTDGFNVHLQYNANVNAVVRKLTAAIEALGGTI